jgi:hypothetical protein
MQTTAKDQIIQQQRTPEQKAKSRRKPGTSTKRYRQPAKKRTNKHPERIADNPPPIHFYQPNRPFESRSATKHEEGIIAEGLFELYKKLHKNW